jgi:hypothetical protein
MAIVLIKILTRDFRAKLKNFNVSLWEKDHREANGTLYLALDKDVFKVAKFICDNSNTDTDFWNKSMMEPIIYPEKPYLRAWRLILSLSKLPVTVSLFQNRVYEITDSLPQNEAKLLIMEYSDKERKKYERLKMKFDPVFIQMMKDPRIRIDEDVRIFVWRRDQGMCAKCGSREALEYDHIIPVSKGGNNLARNVELLCARCNRLKADNIQ